VTFFHTGQYIDSSGALERHTQYLKTAWHEVLVDYALSKPDVRLVSARETLTWIRDPTPL
jgi:hypothetical protein